jgi:hypothetical protein
MTVESETDTSNATFASSVVDTDSAIETGEGNGAETISEVVVESTTLTSNATFTDSEVAVESVARRVFANVSETESVV